jgi:hypothetical protein
MPNVIMAGCFVLAVAVWSFAVYGAIMLFAL